MRLRTILLLALLIMPVALAYHDTHTRYSTYGYDSYSGLEQQAEWIIRYGTYGDLRELREDARVNVLPWIDSYIDFQRQQREYEQGEYRPATYQRSRIGYYYRPPLRAQLGAPIYADSTYLHLNAYKWYPNEIRYRTYYSPRYYR